MADIELVIKIPEELFSKMHDESYQDVIWWYNTTLYCAIKNGTPLPKGHGRLKDVDALYEDLIFPDEQFAKAFKDILDDAQTIIEADKVESEEQK